MPDRVFGYGHVLLRGVTFGPPHDGGSGDEWSRVLIWVCRTEVLCASRRSHRKVERRRKGAGKVQVR
jgi:hypothetical protein